MNNTDPFDWSHPIQTGVLLRNQRTIRSDSFLAKPLSRVVAGKIKQSKITKIENKQEDELPFDFQVRQVFSTQETVFLDPSWIPQINMNTSNNSLIPRIFEIITNGQPNLAIQPLFEKIFAAVKSTSLNYDVLFMLANALLNGWLLYSKLSNQGRRPKDEQDEFKLDLLKIFYAEFTYQLPQSLTGGNITQQQIYEKVGWEYKFLSGLFYNILLQQGFIIFTIPYTAEFLYENVCAEGLLILKDMLCHLDQNVQNVHSQFINYPYTACPIYLDLQPEDEKYNRATTSLPTLSVSDLQNPDFLIDKFFSLTKYYIEEDNVYFILQAFALKKQPYFVTENDILQAIHILINFIKKLYEIVGIKKQQIFLDLVEFEMNVIRYAHENNQFTTSAPRRSIYGRLEERRTTGRPLTAQEKEAFEEFFDFKELNEFLEKIVEKKYLDGTPFESRIYFQFEYETPEAVKQTYYKAYVKNFAIVNQVSDKEHFGILFLFFLSEPTIYPNEIGPILFHEWKFFEIVFSIGRASKEIQDKFLKDLLRIVYAKSPILIPFFESLKSVVYLPKVYEKFGRKLYNAMLKTPKFYYFTEPLTIQELYINIHKEGLLILNDILRQQLANRVYDAPEPRPLWTNTIFTTDSLNKPDRFRKNIEGFSVEDYKSMHFLFTMLNLHARELFTTTEEKEEKAGALEFVTLRDKYRYINLAYLLECIRKFISTLLIACIKLEIKEDFFDKVKIELDLFIEKNKNKNDVDTHSLSYIL